MRQIEGFRPIVTVYWVLDEFRPEGTGFVHRNPHWNVAFYSPDQVPAESVVEIAGIPFIFAAGDAIRLNGATLDVVKGEFVIGERAI